MMWANAVLFRYRLLRVRAKRERLLRAEWLVTGEISAKPRSTWLLLPQSLGHPVLPVILPEPQGETENGTIDSG